MADVFLRMAIRKQLPFLFLTALLLSSCSRSLFPSDMYKVKNVADFSPVEELLTIQQVVIVAGDQLQVSVYSNHGEKLLDPLSAADGNSGVQPSAVMYTVDSEGNVLLPMAGLVSVAGKTIAQVESDLKQIFQKSVVDPYVKVTISNKRVYFFTGGTAQKAQTIELVNENTTLVDVITLAGGLGEGKAHRIHLIRTTAAGQKIYRIDLSDFSQAKYSFIQIHPSDIVYVEPRHRAVREVFQELTPYLTLVSTALLVYNLTR